jgi:hypothetical protein
MSVHVLPDDEVNLHLLALACQCGPRVAEVDYPDRWDGYGVIHNDFVDDPVHVPDNADTILAAWSREPAGIG